jgi:hypothetical protein
MTFAYSLVYGITIEKIKLLKFIMISANADITPKWKAGYQPVMTLYKRELHFNNFALKEIY